MEDYQIEPLTTKDCLETGAIELVTDHVHRFNLTAGDQTSVSSIGGESVAEKRYGCGGSDGVDWEDDCIVIPPVFPMAALADVPLNRLPQEMETTFAFFLDPAGIGDVLQNWQHLAYRLGVTSDRIKHMEERIVHPLSPTVELLRLFPRMSVGRLLDIIVRDLKRLDVAFKLETELKALAQSPAAAANRENNNYSNVPTDPISPIPFSPTASVSSSSNAYHGNQFFGPSGQQPSTSAGSGSIKCYRKEDGTMADHRILLCYYPEDDKDFKMYVRWFERNVKNCGGAVERLIKFIGKHGHVNLTLSVDSLFCLATAIIVIPSKGYNDEYLSAAASSLPPNKMGAEHVQQEEDSTSTSTHNHQLRQAINYLHSQMKGELLCNNSTNRRFYPMTWDNSDAEKYLPMFLRNILLFYWPKQHEDIFKLLFRNTASSASKSTVQSPS